jgi:hypothetical protein
LRLKIPAFTMHVRFCPLKIIHTALSCVGTWPSARELRNYLSSLHDLPKNTHVNATIPKPEV